jgi:hypothetical protein
LGAKHMARIIGGGIISIALLLSLDLSASAQVADSSINDVKVKILDAQSVQSHFSASLKHCSELDGTSFYFQARDRVLKLEDYHRALNNLVLARAFNPETKKPWDQHEADARWEQVRKQASEDKTHCELVASLPFLQKKLQDLQSHAAATK